MTVILISDEGFQVDRGARDGLKKTIDIGIGRAIDREWNRNGGFVYRLE